MAARVCSANQQLYYYLPQLLWDNGKTVYIPTSLVPNIL